MSLLLLASTLLAADVVEVDAAVLTTLASDYRGRRVRTEFSKSAVVRGPTVGCAASEVGILLGPKLRMGERPNVTSRQVALCIAREASTPLVSLPMGEGIVVEADVRLTGMGDRGTLLLADATLIGTVDMATGELRRQP